MQNVRERIAKNLVEKGVCTTERQSFLLFDMLTHPVVDFHAKQRVVHRVQDAILNKWCSNIQSINKRLLSLVVLAHHSQVLENALATLSDNDYDLAKKRLNSVLNADFTAQATKDPTGEMMWAVFAACFS